MRVERAADGKVHRTYSSGLVEVLYSTGTARSSPRKACRRSSSSTTT